MAFLAAARRAAPPAASSAGVRAVIFDLDGTLLDSEKLYRAAFRAAAASFGQVLDDAAYAGLIGLATPDRRSRLSDRFGPAFPMDAFLAEYHRQKRHRAAAGIPLKPGAEPLLNWLAAHGIPAAVATACSLATATRHLAGSGLLHRLHPVVTRDDVRRRKPHPDLFLQTAALLAVPPAGCMVLEDSAPGIEAAQSAGMMAVLVPDLAPPPRAAWPGSFAVLPDLHAVRSLLAEMRRNRSLPGTFE